MLEKFVGARKVEVWVAEFFEGGKGTEECQALIFKRNWCVYLECRVEVGYVKAETSLVPEHTSC